MCSKAREFALALAILECAIKPVVMLPVWKESLGHTRWAEKHEACVTCYLLYVGQYYWPQHTTPAAPVVFINCYVLSIFRLHRMTSIEREEKEKVKKREKKLEDEETLQQATWVKYTIPIKHQVDANSIITLELALMSIKKNCISCGSLPRCGSRGERSIGWQAMVGGVGSVRLESSGLFQSYQGTRM